VKEQSGEEGFIEWIRSLYKNSVKKPDDADDASDIASSQGGD
jgi:hypothetical protein